VKAGTLEIELVTNVARLQKQMRDVQRAVGTMQDGVVGDVEKIRKGFDNAGVGMVSMGNKAKLSSHHVQNLTFQLNDMVVGLASGQKPLTVFLQQGSQIGGIMSQAGIGVMGLTRALLGMAGAAAMAVATNPLLLGLAVAVGTAYGAFKLFQSQIDDSGALKDYANSLGLTKDEMKELSDVTITFGDVLRGTWKTILDAFPKLSLGFANLKSVAVDTFIGFLKISKYATAGVYAAFVGTKDGIVDNWRNFPAIVGDFAISAANATITAVEWMANKVITAINKLSGFANSAFEAMGVDTRLGQIGAVKFDRLDNAYAGAGAKAANSFASSYKAAFAQAMGGMDAAGSTLWDNIVGKAKDRLKLKASDILDDRTVKALGKKADEFAENLLDTFKRIHGDINDLTSDILKGAGVKIEADPLKAWRERRNEEWEAAQRLEEYRNQEAKERRDAEIEMARQFGDIVGGKLGKLFDGIAQILEGLQTGNFGNGKLGGILNLLNQTKGADGKGLIDRLGKKLDGVFSNVFGKDGVFSDALQGAGIGVGVAQLMGGGTAKSIGGAIGGAAGKALGTAIGGPLGGAIGSVLGSIGGSLIGGAFAKTKKGSSTLGFTNGQLGVTSTVGNSNSRKEASISLGGGVSDQLAQIADMLGGDLNGAISTSIGMRKKKYVVDTTGQGRTKGAGVLKFADENAAIRAAIEDALQDGVITGISAAAKHILASGKDLQKAIEQAADIESIPKRLKAYQDPIGAAIDDLNAKWDKTIKTLTEAGASSEQWAQAQKLYSYELAEVKDQTVATSNSLREFLDSLNFGSSSPLSLRDQDAAARSALQPFLDAIDAGKGIDQDAYQSAAQAFLDIERQLKGSTDGFFAEFDKIKTYTARAIGTADASGNVVPIVSEDPFSKATALAAQQTADASTATAQILSQHTVLLATIGRYLGTIVAAPVSNDFAGATRGFTATPVQRVARK
jgi:hypothetical protein